MKTEGVLQALFEVWKGWHPGSGSNPLEVDRGKALCFLMHLWLLGGGSFYLFWIEDLE